MKRSNIIVTVVCWLAVIGLFFTLIYPKYQNWQGLRLEIKERTAELQTKKEYFDQVKQITEYLNTYEASLVKISSALPEEVALPSLTNFLQQAAGENGLVLEKISIDSVSQSSSLKRLKETSLSLELSGSYEGLKSFLAGLEQSARMVSVASLSFDSPEEEDDSFKFVLNIKAFSY